MREKHQAILDAAVGLAHEKGIKALSVRSVAAAAGIGATTLRHYFPTQDELVEAVLEKIFHDNIKDLRIHDVAVPPVDRLTECLLQFFGAEGDTDKAAKAWFDMIVAMLGKGATEASRRGIVIANRVTAVRVEGWLRILQAEGVVPEGEVAVDVTILLALVEGLMLHALADPERVARREINTAMRGCVERMVRV